MLFLWFNRLNFVLDYTRIINLVPVLKGTMPKPGWTNLSIKTDDYDRARRLFDTEVTTNLSWTEWLVDTILSAMERKKFLKAKYPHLRFIGNTETGCVIEDTKARKIVNITLKNGRLESSDKDEQYLIFSSLNPELRIK